MTIPPLSANFETEIMDSCNCCAWRSKKAKTHKHKIKIKSDDQMDRIEVVFDHTVKKVN